MNNIQQHDMREIKRYSCKPEVDWFNGRNCQLSPGPSCE